VESVLLLFGTRLWPRARVYPRRTRRFVQSVSSLSLI